MPFDLAPGSYQVVLHYVFDPSGPDPNFAYAAHVSSAPVPLTVT